MAVGLHKHTVQESVNASLGQGGSLFIKNTSGANEPSSGDFVAITVVEDCAFDALVPKDATMYFGTADDDAGDELDENTTFSAGITIFGRWTSFTLNTGSVIAYQG